VRRRRRYILIGGATGVAGVAAFGGLVVTGMLGGGSYWVYTAVRNRWVKHLNRKVVHRLSPKQSPTGEERVIRRWHVQGARLAEAAHGTLALRIPDVTHRDPKTSFWGTRRYSDEEIVLSGAEAHGVLVRSIVHINAKGATRQKVQEAVRLLSAAPSAEDYLRQWGRLGGVLGERPKMEHNRLPRESALALEMALHEEAERRAMEGELALLEQAWKEAEEIAAIAHSLALPPALERLMCRPRFG
jgi:hypothetical protein